MVRVGGLIHRQYMLFLLFVQEALPLCFSTKSLIVEVLRNHYSVKRTATETSSQPGKVSEKEIAREPV